MIRGLVLVLMLVLVWGCVAQWMMRLDLSLMMRHWRIVPQRWVLREEAGIVHLYDTASTIAIEKGFRPQLHQISFELQKSPFPRNMVSKERHVHPSRSRFTPSLDSPSWCSPCATLSIRRVTGGVESADGDVEEGESGSERSEDGTPNNWASRVRSLSSSGRREDDIVKMKGIYSKVR